MHSVTSNKGISTLLHINALLLPQRGGWSFTRESRDAHLSSSGSMDTHLPSNRSSRMKGCLSPVLSPPAAVPTGTAWLHSLSSDLLLTMLGGAGCRFALNIQLQLKFGIRIVPLWQKWLFSSACFGRGRKIGFIFFFTVMGVGEYHHTSTSNAVLWFRKIFIFIPSSCLMDCAFHGLFRNLKLLKTFLGNHSLSLDV